MSSIARVQKRPVLEVWIGRNHGLLILMQIQHVFVIHEMATPIV